MTGRLAGASRAIEELGVGAALLARCLRGLVIEPRHGDHVRVAFLEELKAVVQRRFWSLSLAGVAIGVVAAAAMQWLPIPVLDLLGPTAGLGAIGVALVREIVPLFLGSVVAARSAVALVTRFAGMARSNALDSLVMLGIDPATFVLLPAMLGTVVGMVVAGAWCTILALAGAALWFSVEAGVPWTSCLPGTIRDLSMRHLLLANAKLVAVGLVVPLLAAVHASRRDVVPGGGGDAIHAAESTIVQSMLAVALIAVAFAGL